MLEHLYHVVIGPPIETKQAKQERLNKIRALAAFSPDALSSIAYANQEIYLSLAVAGAAGLQMAWPIGLAISGLLVIVALSYFQTIHGYPNGGGAYIVAKENLGTGVALVAAAALLLDYLLTAAVSLTAGVEAIASAFPILWQHKVGLALILLFILTILNLRGLRDTGTIMAIPVYFFLITYIPMLIYGVTQLLLHGLKAYDATMIQVSQPVTFFLILHAFSTGCTALTGIEAISNGVPAFKAPESQNAGKTLIAMAFIMGFLFVGSIGLTQFLAIVPKDGETILSALARYILGSGPAYYIIQISTLLILAVAANTSFADFPRLSAILARDGFLPHQLIYLGDRLVYSNGIILLSLSTAALIIIFKGDTHALIPLFAIGAFMAFTLSQSGMVIHWKRIKGKNWKVKSFLNGLGAFATAITIVVIGISKFIEGAWITILMIPLLVLGFRIIHDHYKEIQEQLAITTIPKKMETNLVKRVVIPVAGITRGIEVAINFGRTISADVTAVYIEIEPGSGELIRQRWEKLWPEIPLVVISSPYRSIVRPFLDYLDETDRQHHDGCLA
ncbi:MAG: APC family permease, partial [Anaerolineales bacterium]